jgi:hypothetical protein
MRMSELGGDPYSGKPLPQLWQPCYSMPHYAISWDSRMAGYPIVRSPEEVPLYKLGLPEVSQVLLRHGADANAEGRDAMWRGTLNVVGGCSWGLGTRTCAGNQGQALFQAAPQTSHH